VAVSSLSLVVSLSTLWLTLLRRGTVKMTLPTTVFFGPDGGEAPRLPKVYFRALLYSTGKRGHIIESMSVRLRRGESSQVFNIWVHGERHQLVRGSGLYVGSEGVASTHHFLLPKDGTSYQFLPGTYNLEVFATLVGRSKPLVLRRIRLDLADALAGQINADAGVYFDWGAESQQYQAHAEAKRRERPAPPFLPMMFSPELFFANEEDVRGEASSAAGTKTGETKSGGGA